MTVRGDGLTVEGAGALMEEGAVVGEWCRQIGDNIVLVKAMARRVGNMP